MLSDTRRKELVDQKIKIWDAIDDAIKILELSPPHEPDYEGDSIKYDNAMRAHRSRLYRLRKVAGVIYDEGLLIEQEGLLKVIKLG